MKSGDRVPVAASVIINYNVGIQKGYFFITVADREDSMSVLGLP